MEFRDCQRRITQIYYHTHQFAQPLDKLQITNMKRHFLWSTQCREHHLSWLLPFHDWQTKREVHAAGLAYTHPPPLSCKGTFSISPLTHRYVNGVLSAFSRFHSILHEGHDRILLRLDITWTTMAMTTMSNFNLGFPYNCCQQQANARLPSQSNCSFHSSTTCAANASGDNQYL